MPRTRAAKRAAQTAASAGAPKRQKLDPALQQVADAVDKAAHIPEASRTMLISCLPSALGTYQDERHETQNLVVGMLGEVVEQVTMQLQQAADAEERQVAETEARKAQLGAEVEGAKAHLEARSEETKVKKHALADISSGLQAAKSTLVERKKDQRDGDANLVKDKAAKEELELGVEAHVKVLVEGTAEDLSMHYNASKPLLKHVKLDDSLTSAFASSAQKKAADRGGFDGTVLEQLRMQLMERIAELTKAVDGAAPAADERAKAVDSAQSEVERGTASQVQAAGELTASQEAEAAAKASLATALSAVAAYDPEYTKATGARDEKVADLCSFKSSSVAAFGQLRDLVSPKAAAVVEEPKVEELKPDVPLVEETPEDQAS